MKKISILLATVFSWSLLSCSDDFPNEADSAIEGQPAFPATTISADSALAGFAKILSTAVSERKDVREFLKSEALKKFDKNYDVKVVNVNTSADISNEKASQNTDKISTTVTEKWTETSDDLGQVRIYYYDPVVVGMNGSSPIVKTYNTGSVEFGVFVK